jgi:hypothetical protein
VVEQVRLRREQLVAASRHVLVPAASTGWSDGTGAYESSPLGRIFACDECWSGCGAERSWDDRPWTAHRCQHPGHHGQPGARRILEGSHRYTQVQWVKQIKLRDGTVVG